MDTGGRLVAGSRNRNEFVVINADDIGKPKPLQQTSGQICQICEDGIELVGGEQEKEPFVACNECAFPVCRTCYEYERKEGTQACPHCKTRYKRHKGSARVHGDEEEDGNDDVEDEFSFFNPENVHNFSETTSVTGGAAQPEHRRPGFNTNVPLLTYGEEVDGISSDDHALVPSFMNGGGTHPVPYQGTTQPRVINPKKDVSLYGYGSVAWKDRMEDWRGKQINKPHNNHPEAGYRRGLDGDGIDNPDLPM